MLQLWQTIGWLAMPELEAYYPAIVVLVVLWVLARYIELWLQHKHHSVPSVVTTRA